MDENVSDESVDVSFETDIVPLFRPLDIEVMRSRGTFLTSFEWMSIPKNYDRVMSYLKPGKENRMPLGGPYWSDESIQLLQSWIDGNCKP